MAKQGAMDQEAKIKSNIWIVLFVTVRTLLTLEEQMSVVHTLDMI